MNDWDLRIFETVARLGGIGRAADELNTMQSNVTTRMRHLEEELGVPLLDRHSRGVMPALSCWTTSRATEWDGIRKGLDR